MTVAPNEEGHNYYEQYNIVGNGVIKLGDYVYVATDTGKQSIAQVQSIWDTKEYVLNMKFDSNFLSSIPVNKIKWILKIFIYSVESHILKGHGYCYRQKYQVHRLDYFTVKNCYCQQHKI